MDRDYAQYLLEKTRNDYNAIAEEFSSTRRFIWPGLKPLYYYASPGDKVLDLGCGNGRLLQFFKEAGVDYTGVDSSEKLIELARKKYPDAKFEAADALHLPFPGNFFDKIYSIAVLHHIPSEQFRLDFLKEAKRVLKPGGLLILTVWNLWQRRSFKYNLKYAVLKILGLSKLDFKDVFVPWGKTRQRYFHCFSGGELKAAVQKAGFKIEETGILKMKENGETNLFVVAQNRILTK